MFASVPSGDAIFMKVNPRDSASPFAWFSIFYSFCSSQITVSLMLYRLKLITKINIALG